MYIFKAHYINMETEECTIRTIRVDGQFFDSEKDCYLYAMGIAYDIMENYECFESLEFICC